jgi:hypothetical protein
MSSILKVDTIQDQNGNNIINENANTITIGASGDTISIPAGATLVNNGTASGFGIAWQSVQTTGFTAVKGNAYPCDTTSAGFTVTLPATPSAGDQVQLVDYAGTFDTNALTISPNGNKIESGTVNLELTGERVGVILTYIDSTQGWLASSGINEGTDALKSIPPKVDFLVVAGGAGGGAGTGGSSGGAGGGGAGGLRSSVTATGGGGSLESFLTLAVATNYTVTVGAGGNGASTQNVGANGSNSVFSTITSTGGGGGSRGGNVTGNAASGGSGGGGAGNAPITGGSGTANQGFAGGSGGAAGNDGGGGGGGASAVGVAASTLEGGNGGAGVATSITGSSVTYAGGGGGGDDESGTGAGGTGGTGGGGNGGGTGASTTGTVNTGGGGGGGAGGTKFGVGANGGSGVVIVKYQDNFTITNPGGGLTFSTATAGGFKTTSFTAGTGTIQFN